MQNLDVRESEVVTIFKEVFKQIGWGDEDIRLIEQASIPWEPKLCVAVAFQIPVSTRDVMTTNKPFMSYFKNLLEKARNSELVKDELALVEQKLIMANKASDELMERIKELEKYKMHHDLEMELRHGKEQK